MSIDETGDITNNLYENEIDIQYSVPSGTSNKNITSKLEVPFRKNLRSSAIIKLIDTDLESTYIIPYNKDLSSIARVTENSEMDISYKLIQAPVLLESLYPIMDTYTREARPTLNHGTRQTLITGTMADGSYITYLDINISKIKDILLVNGMQVRDINLILNLAEYMDGTISIFECVTSWSEYSLTWSTSVVLGNLIAEKEVTSTDVILNIAEYVLNLISLGKTNFRVAIKSDSTFFIKSRETEDSPKIILKYFDPQWNAFPDEKEIFSSVTIRNFNSSDLNTKVNIFNHKNINSKVVIEMIETDLTSKVVINSKQNYNNIKGKVTFRKLQTEVASSAIILNKNKGDIKSSYYQPNISRKSIVDIKQIKDISSRILILSDILNEDLNSTSFMLLRNIKSVVEITGNSVVSSSAKINSSNKKDLSSKSTIRKLIKDFSSHASIRDNKSADINSSANIIGGYLRSTFSLRISEDLQNTAWIVGKISNDFDSKVVLKLIEDTVTLDSSVNIKSIYDINSKAEIKSGENYEMSSSVKVRISLTKDISSEVDLKNVENINSIVDILYKDVMLSSAIINQNDIIEVISTVLVSSENVFETFTGTAIIQQRINNFQYSIIDIKTSARMWVPTTHAREIFGTYPNNKLPRQWNKSNFIN